jgi:hypothetical protein
VAEVVGTHVGEILGLAPPAAPFRIPMAFILECRRQDRLRAAHLRLHGLLVQIGVLKAKPVG